MSLVGSLLCDLRAAISTAETRFSVEKSKVQAVQAQAHTMFMVAYEEVCKISTNCNSGAKMIEHAELLVSAAECAFATENYKIAREIAEKYLLYAPQHDQYYCRAKLLVGRLIVVESNHLHGAELIKKSVEAGKEMLTALDIATATENRGRYDFIVYNTSLRYYELVRPFLRRGTANSFAAEMQRISSALLALPDADKEWNVTFLSASAYCLNDSKQLSAAGDTLDRALEIAEDQLAESTAAEEDAMNEAKANTKQMDELHKEIHSVEAELEQRAKDGTEELVSTLAKLNKQLTDCQRIAGDLKAKCSALSERTQPLSDRVSRLYLQRIHMNPADAKKVAAQVASSLRNKALAAVHTLAVTSASEQEKNSTVASLFSELSNAVPSVTTAETLFDCARLIWSLNLPDMARQMSQKASDVMREHSLVAPVLMVKQDLTSALFLIADAGFVTPSDDEMKLLSSKQQIGQSVHKRLEAAKILERVMSVCQARLRDAALTQEICVAMWNAILPLLQPHLRKHIYRPLQLISSALADINSPMLLLRTQVHFELAKCEEQFDFVVKARDETSKALNLDYGVYKQQSSESSAPATKQLAKATTRQLSAAAPDSTPDQLNEVKGRCDYEKERQLDIHIDMLNSNLTLRSNVYGSPDTIEEQVELNLQQIKESTSKKYRSDMLVKSAAMMFESMIKNNLGESVVVRAIQSGDVVPLELLQSVLEEDKSSSALQSTDFTEIRKPILQRVGIMMNLAILGHQAQAQQRHSTVRFTRNDSSSIVQKCLVYVLSQLWDPSDPMIRTYLIQQISAMCMLAESVIDRMNHFDVTDDDWIEVRDRRGMRTPLCAEEETAMDESNTRDDLDIDPRALGIAGELNNRPEGTVAMMQIKKLVILALSRALVLAVALEDAVALQNVLIYFWNMHMHIFRGNLYSLAMSEVHDFLHAAAEALDKISKSKAVTAAPIDEKLKLTILEAHVMSLVSTNNLSSAIEVATRAASQTSCPAYHRKRIAELLCRLSLLPAAGAPSKGKGAEGTVPKFDDAFLNVFALVVVVEADVTPIDAKKQNIVKAIATIDAEVVRQIRDTNLLVLSRESRDQIQEMAVEAYTRLTRANIKLGNIHSANETAEKCLRIVAEGITTVTQKTSDSSRSIDDQFTGSVHKRVWRWASLCERFFGKAISQLIKSEGQDVTLQLQLRIASLRHFTVGSKFGVNASIDHLVEIAGVDAWNVAMPLLDHINSSKDNEMVSSFITLLKQVIDSLLQCHPSTRISVLKQQFYLALIEIHAELGDWSAAMETVISAFDNTPTELQKPLWKWRVVVMSKRGKNVLDGLQKLKENDPTLQARVYAILARSAAKQSVQHDAYRKALDILKDDINRADYALETAQWMATNGFAKSAVADTIRLALDAISEVDDVIMDDAISESQSANTTSSRHTARRTVRKTVRSSTTKSHQSKRRKSRSERSLDALQGERSPGLTLANFDQAMRGNAMLGMMAVTEADRTKYCLDAMDFVTRSLKKWQETVSSIAVTLAAALGPPSDAGETAPNAVPSYTKLPEDLLDFMAWIPSSDLSALMKQGRLSSSNINIPCEESLQFVPLTVSALVFMAEVLERAGYCKRALQCLAWARVCVMFTDDLPHSTQILLQLHFHMMSVLFRSNATGIELSRTIGRSDMSPANAYSELMSSVETIRIDENSNYNSTNGIPAWTNRLEDHDVMTAALSLCRTFVDMSMLPYGAQLAKRLQQCAANTSSRVYAEAALILARIALMGGDYDSAVSSALSLSHSVASFNDAKMLRDHACVLIKSYARLFMVKESSAVAADTFIALEAAAVRTVPAEANSSCSTTNLSTRATLTRSTISAMRGEYGGGDSGVEMDHSAAQALVAVTHVYAEEVLIPLIHDRMLQLRKSKKQLTSFEDEFLCDIAAVYERCLDLVLRVAGNSSLLYAECLSQQAQHQANILLHFHKHYSSTLQCTTDAYANWIVDQITKQVNLAEQAHGILLEYKAQLNSVNSVSIIPAGDANSTRVDMISLVTRMLANVQVFISQMLVLYPLLHGKHAPPIDFDASSVTENYTVIDKYLDATSSAAKPAALSDMLDEGLMKADELTSEVQAGHCTAAIISLASQLTREIVVSSSTNGDASSVWRQPSTEQSGSIAAAPSIEASASIENAPSVDMAAAASQPLHVTIAPSLCEMVKKQMNDSFGLMPCESSILGCMTIADAIGVTAPAKTAGWLLTAQSIRSRDYLMGVWRNSLNSQSEVAESLNRMCQLLSIGSMDSVTAKLESESVFLRNSCPTWNRLSISEPAGAIASSSLLSEKTCLISLVCCPVSNVVYAVAGFPKIEVPSTVAPAKPAAKAAKPAKGEVVEVKEVLDPLVAGLPGRWMVDKMLLSEKSRRSLQILLSQHGEWREQVSKFISSFGEALPVPMDYENQSALGTNVASSSSVKTILRSEHAIEEQFKSHVADLDALLHPLLGKGSAIDTFIRGISNQDAVLLLDPQLLDLPWETLPLFQDAFSGRVSRDFSVHMLLHRLASLERNAGGKAVKGSVGAKGVVSASTMRVVLDPYNDASKNPLGIAKQPTATTPATTPRPDQHLDIQPGILASYDSMVSSLAGAAKWREVVSRDRRGAGIGVQDWLDCCDDSSGGGGLMLYAPGKVLGNLISLKELAALDLSNTCLAFISSLGHTDASYRRQLSVDSRKHASEVSKETPLRLSILLALAGIGAAVVTQWSTSFASQHRYTSLFFDAFTKRGRDVISAVADAAQLYTAPAVKEGSKSVSMDIGEDVVAMKWRLWVKHARVIYGCGNIIYNSDA